MGQPAEPIEENPYAAPGEGLDGSALTSVYRLSLAAISYRELRTISLGWPSFAVFCAFKALGRRLPVQIGIPRFDRLDWVERPEIPPDSREALRESARACEAAGMAHCASYRSPVVARGGDDFASVYRSGDGRTLACLVAHRARGPRSRGSWRRSGLPAGSGTAGSW